MRAFPALALLCSLDAHLPVLQVVAWTGMIASSARQDGLAEAIRDTFDGQHPCRLCRAIEREQHQPSESLKAAPVMPNDALPVARSDFTVAPPATRLAFAPSPESADAACFPPDVPPPRRRA